MFRVMAAISPGFRAYQQKHPKMFNFLRGSANFGIWAGLGGFIGYNVYTIVRAEPKFQINYTKPKGWKESLPSREEIIKSLQSGEEYDVVVIGGGASGTGVAVDAISRGLKTALVERDDFASGTSSRSTKLIHGGVRYLQAAIMRLDKEQFDMVTEALQERKNLLDIAPHLTRPLPIMLPVYKWWQLPYYWVGIKMYDVVAGTQLLKHSYIMDKEKTIEHFPMLKAHSLKGSIVYYDGQQNDARMCTALALTAARLGADVSNHMEVIDFMYTLKKNKEKSISGARLRDTITGKEFNIKTKCVINCTGPFTDEIRKMDDDSVRSIVQPSLGVHITLPRYFAPDSMGLLDPQTSDGRVIFFLPWEGMTIAGTTDSRCNVTDAPQASRADVEFIMTEVQKYLSPRVKMNACDVTSAWAGIRPLVTNPKSPDTKTLARNHIIDVAPSNLITLAGGKWTTYRNMAQETVDAAIKACNLSPRVEESQTLGLTLEGGHGWTPTSFIEILQSYNVEQDVATHLTHYYGDRAATVAGISRKKSDNKDSVLRRLVKKYPYTEADVIHACRNEYALTAIDMIGRRMRLAFQDVKAAEEALPAVVDLMAEELGWSSREKRDQIEAAKHYLSTQMGGNVLNSIRSEFSRSRGISLAKEEIDDFVRGFHESSDREGTIPVQTMSSLLNELGVFVHEHKLTDLLNEKDIDVERIGVGDYLSAISDIRQAEKDDHHFKKLDDHQSYRSPTCISASGGGL